MSATSQTREVAGKREFDCIDQCATWSQCNATDIHREFSGGALRCCSRMSSVSCFIFRQYILEESMRRFYGAAVDRKVGDAVVTAARRTGAGNIQGDRRLGVASSAALIIR